VTPSTDLPSTRWIERVFAIVVHGVLVFLCLVATLAIYQNTPLMPGEALDCIAACTLVFLGAAFIAGCCFRRVSLLSCAIVLGIAFLPGALELLAQHHRAYQTTYVLPGDRFRDHLGPTIPPSVKNLRFVPLDDRITTDLILQFDIDRADLEALFDRLGAKHVEPEELPNPDDFFRHSFYLPVGGPFELYQVRIPKSVMITFKTNASRTHAICRYEYGSVYDEREWEHPNRTTYWNNIALERLKRKHDEKK
jgi:hypothetical protein